MDDKSCIKRTLRLASKASGMTNPNPMVGAVITRDGRIIAEDYHKKAGMPHAEVLAIQKAGEKAKGATLYVSLEPCCHTNKRTPPCTKAIIKAGIKKVVAAMKDPNPKVSGKGIKELESSGIEVISGVLEEKARRLNESYIKYITTRKPFVILKSAMTLDGKIATPSGQSKWITGERSRRMVHRIRSSVDAVLTAIGTVKADDPELTVRTKQAKRSPIRIVIDPNLQIPLNAKILNMPPETIIIAKGPAAGSRQPAVKEKKKILLNSGIRIIEFEDDKLDLNWLIKRLGETGITSLLIEGGSSLNAHAFEDGIVDKVLFFIAPKIIGGRNSYTVVGGKTFRRLEDAYRLIDVKLKRVGDDFLVEGYIRK